MKLYGHPDSGHAFKVKFCLNTAKIPHDYEVIDIFADKDSRNPDFVKRSKFCEVPLLVDEGKNFIQSNAILVYIAKKYSIYGANSIDEMQKCIEWLAWEANKIGMSLPQLRGDIKLTQFAQFRLDEDARKWLHARYLYDVGVIDDELKDGRKYIIGDNLTIADFSLCAYLMYAAEVNIFIPKNVETWLERLQKLPNWSNPYTMLKA